MKSCIVALMAFALAQIGLASPSFAQPARVPPGAQNLCKNHSWACSGDTRGSVRDSGAILTLAHSVNRSVNARIKPRTDQSLYGVEEHWTLPVDAGDCEDYALLKMRMLIDRGVPPSRLRLAQVMKRSVPSHVVLIVEPTPGSQYVLDSLQGGITPRDDSPYVFLKIQKRNNPASWETGI
jgi:predicted transglutaminase-like cysteine proteinase